MLDVQHDATLQIGGKYASRTTLAAGSVDNQGTIDLNPDGQNAGHTTIAASLVAQGGTFSGGPMLLNNVSLDASGSGRGSFEARAIATTP